MHQSSTDSLMVARAWTHLDHNRAQDEMMALFSGQWANGLVPTIRFARGYSADYLGGTLMPGPAGWGSLPSVGDGAGEGGGGTGYNTSGLAALPLHAETTLQIFELSQRDSEARLWLQHMFPALYRYHEYLHGARGDPAGTGLVSVYHPWETEVSPDSTVWPGLLEETREQAANESWTPPSVPQEVSSLPGFPGEDLYSLGLYLVKCSAQQGYVDARVRDNCPFQLQDVQFNAALFRSDMALLELAKVLEGTRSSWQSKVYSQEQYENIQAWAEAAEGGRPLSHLWSEESGMFLSRYISTKTSEASLVRPATSSSFSGLLSDLTPSAKAAGGAVDRLLSPGDLSFRCGDYPVPEVECSVWEEGSGLGGGRGGKGKAGARAGATMEREGTRAGASILEVQRVVLQPGGGGDGEKGTWLPKGNGDGVGGSSSALKGEGARRAWVLHNLLAQRGLQRQGLPGVSIWLADATLGLIDKGRGDRGIGEGRGGALGWWWQWGGGGTTGAVAGADPVFARVFDAETGEVWPDGHGNASSLSAAAAVLFMLGDAPEGEEDFPPVTHAVLFGLMLVELAVSFGIGAACLMFSLNLVRKLHDEEPEALVFAQSVLASTWDDAEDEIDEDRGNISGARYHHHHHHDRHYRNNIISSSSSSSNGNYSSLSSNPRNLALEQASGRARAVGGGVSALGLSSASTNGTGGNGIQEKVPFLKDLGTEHASGSRGTDEPGPGGSNRYREGTEVTKASSSFTEYRTFEGGGADELAGNDSQGLYQQLMGQGGPPHYIVDQGRGVEDEEGEGEGLFGAAGAILRPFARYLRLW
ncbi:unnamed protein product [Discosporangium mesarthrocarpum]